MAATNGWSFWATPCWALVTAEYLYRRHPDLPEGDLTRIRAALVCEESLHEVAQTPGTWDSYLKLGKGEEAGGGRHRPSILADATEAVFAAVYLDGGIERRVGADPPGSAGHGAGGGWWRSAAGTTRPLLQELVQRKAGQELTYCMVRRGRPGPRQDASLLEVRLNGTADRRGQRPQQEGIRADGRQIRPGKAGRIK